MKFSDLSWFLPLIEYEWKNRRTRHEPTLETHLILTIADHFEPEHGGVSSERAQARVHRWTTDYPKMLGAFRDSDGLPPRHTFFFPIEAYHARQVEPLAELCRAGYGEVEIHLHHDHDSAENLRARLLEAVRILSESHGLLSRHRETGAIGYGFIHGNWALNNSRPDGRWCGVNDEIRILRETGCYADFTFPSSPSPPRPFFLNQHYYARSRADSPCGHREGTPVGQGTPADSLLLVQGPLTLNWERSKWGLIPRLENGCIQLSQPATLDRLPLWLKAGIGVPSRPDWRFVKLYAHGATERDQPALIGKPMVEFHQGLADFAEKHPNFHYHYVTAREMYNLIKAAEAGWQGDVQSARDFERIWLSDRSDQTEQIEPTKTSSVSNSVE